MITRENIGLKTRDFKRLLNVPESDIMGEIIRLNCTVYSNCLDVIKVCNFILENKQK